MCAEPLIRTPLIYIFTFVLAAGVCVIVNEVCEAVGVKNSSVISVNVGAIFVVVTAVILPFESTVMIGIAVVLP